MRKRKSDWSRFVNMVIVQDGCWGWKGSKTHGYAQTSTYRNGKMVSIAAHRISFWAFFGYLPEEIHHLCRNKICTNPLHLLSTDHMGNMEFERKRFCKRGHDLKDSNNIYIHPKRGYRHCRTCRDLGNKTVAEKRRLGIYKR